MILYLYFDKLSGKTIAIRSKRNPKPKRRMHIVFEWNIESQKYVMAPFPEIPNSTLFSDRFVKLGVTYQND